MSIFEVFMLVCFGFAWPTSIYKSITSKSIEGKSVLFLYIILLGYLMGMLHKLLYSYDFVIVLYLINFLMVFTDLMLYYRNKRLAS
jgi:hypothetical protein